MRDGAQRPHHSADGAVVRDKYAPKQPPGFDCFAVQQEPRCLLPINENDAIVWLGCEQQDRRDEAQQQRQRGEGVERPAGEAFHGITCTFVPHSGQVPLTLAVRS